MSECAAPFIASTVAPWLANRSEIRDKLPQGTKLMAGALVFKDEDTEQGPSLKTLLLRRASTDSYPLLWEHSAGTEDPGDSSLIHTAIRELHEETGLVVRSVLAAVGSGCGTSSYDLNSDSWQDCEVDVGIGKMILLRGPDRQFWAKVTFWVEVEDYEVILDENEHCEWKFATESEVRNQGYVKDSKTIQLDLISDNLKGTILQGFQLVSLRTMQQTRHIVYHQVDDASTTPRIQAE